MVIFSMKTTKNTITHLKTKHNIVLKGESLPELHLLSKQFKLPSDDRYLGLSPTRIPPRSFYSCGLSTPILASVCVSNRVSIPFAPSWLHASLTIPEFIEHYLRVELQLSVIS